MRRGVAAFALALALASAVRAQEAPAAADVQAAYDAAAATAGDLHVTGLKVLGVKCDPSASGRFSCEVGFSLPAGDADRVYLDVASVVAQAGGWKLVSGLCRRLN